jgi:hypothetical protein
LAEQLKRISHEKVEIPCQFFTLLGKTRNSIIERRRF